VSSIQCDKSYLKRITTRLLEITRDENPRDKIQNMTEEYRRIKKRRLEATARSRQQ
jgi:hypothetical protein